jgi:hypothetical protein
LLNIILAPRSFFECLLADVLLFVIFLLQLEE